MLRACTRRSARPPLARERTGGKRLLRGTPLFARPPGNLGSYADAGAVAKWLLSTGCTMWQLLPLNEVSPGQDSPYAASSSCALESVYIDLDSVEDLDGRLTDDEKRKLDADRRDERVDFEAVRSAKQSALRRAWERFRTRELGGTSAPAGGSPASQKNPGGCLPMGAVT